MKKTIFGLVVLSMLLLGSVQALDDATSVNRLTRAVSDSELEELKADIPSYDVAAEAVAVMPVPSRFLIWTRDGKHIMWGTHANGHFIGQDNEGKKTWGIYHNGIFVGFQDGNFFYGRYKYGRWYARGLFGMRSASGRYIIFPTLRPILVEPISIVSK